MGEKHLKKGEGQKIVLNATNKWKTRKEIQKETGLNYSTIDEALKVLFPIKVEKSETFDIKGTKVVKYRSKISNDAIDPEYLKLLMRLYNSGIKVKYNRACREMIDLIYNSKDKLLDINFIDFVIEKRLKDHSKEKSSYTGGQLNFHFIGFHEFDTIAWDDYFYELFSGTIQKLKKDIDKDPENADKTKELLDYIKLKTVDSLRLLATDDKYDLMKRSLAFKNLNLMNHQGTYLLAFDFLKKEPVRMGEGTDFDFLFYDIESIIKSYYDINRIDCMKRLWDAYDFQQDTHARNKILKLIDTVKGKERKGLFAKLLQKERKDL